MNIPTMLAFGDPWGPFSTEQRGPAPVGSPCLSCTEPIAASDQGVVVPFFNDLGRLESQAMHRACYLRSVFGSVGHQMGICPCYGGTVDDPMGLTKRQAAEAAAEYLMTVGPNTPPAQA